VFLLSCSPDYPEEILRVFLYVLSGERFESTLKRSTVLAGDAFMIWSARDRCLIPGRETVKGVTENQPGYFPEFQ
jgi:hypothetical protein